MHPTQIQVTDTVTPACAAGIPAAAATPGADDSVRDVLLAAAQYLSEHGWNQHSFYADTHTANPAACTVGALSMVCYGYPAESPTLNYTHPAHRTFDAALYRVECYVDATRDDDDDDEYDTSGVVIFNDASGRTAAEVVAMLRDAAAWVPGTAVGAALGGAE
jgi:hypothetical protein